MLLVRLDGLDLRHRRAQVAIVAQHALDGGADALLRDAERQDAAELVEHALLQDLRRHAGRAGDLDAVQRMARPDAEDDRDAPRCGFRRHHRPLGVERLEARERSQRRRDILLPQRLPDDDGHHLPESGHGARLALDLDAHVGDGLPDEGLGRILRRRRAGAEEENTPGRRPDGRGARASEDVTDAEVERERSILVPRQHPGQPVALVVLDEDDFVLLVERARVGQHDLRPDALAHRQPDARVEPLTGLRRPAAA